MEAKTHRSRARLEYELSPWKVQRPAQYWRASYGCRGGLWLTVVKRILTAESQQKYLLLCLYLDLLWMFSLLFFLSFPPDSHRLFHHPILISYWFPPVYIQCFYWICDSSYILICKSSLLLNVFLQRHLLILVTIRTFRVINYVFLHEDVFLFPLGSFLCLLCFSSFFHIISFLRWFLILDVCSYLRVRQKKAD